MFEKLAVEKFKTGLKFIIINFVDTILKSKSVIM